MTVLDSNLKSRVPVFDVGGDENTGEVRVFGVDEKSAVVVYLAANTIKSALVTCNY